MKKKYAYLKKDDGLISLFQNRFYFTIHGYNGEEIARSQRYTRKDSAMSILNTYFVEWTVVDETKAVKS